MKKGATLLLGFFFVLIHIFIINLYMILMIFIKKKQNYVNILLKSIYSY